MAIKRANKVDLAAVIMAECGVSVSPDALFDVQIKRLHEYKRQHLNLLHIMALYRRLLQDPDPGYCAAGVHFRGQGGARLRSGEEHHSRDQCHRREDQCDPRLGGKLKVAFLPNYRVSPGRENHSGGRSFGADFDRRARKRPAPGNMKLSLNGALTIGTLDGANVEIKEEVGDENIFIFGMTVDEVHALRKKGYNPWEYYNKDEELRAIIDWLGGDYFTPDEPPGVLSMLRDNLYYSDPFLCLADFQSYSEEYQEEGRCGFPRKVALVEDGDSKHSQNGEVFERPRDSGICTGHLEIGSGESLTGPAFSHATAEAHSPVGAARAIQITRFTPGPCCAAKRRPPPDPAPAGALDSGAAACRCGAGISSRTRQRMEAVSASSHSSTSILARAWPSTVHGRSELSMSSWCWKRNSVK